MLYRNGQEVTLPGVEAAYMGAVCVYSSGVDASVSGVSPLTLPNALARPMQSLVQYGKCAQSATPAPDVPADIVCNNGTLQIVDDELPSGYDRIAGIAFDSSAYYQITDFFLKGSDTIRISFSVEKACNVFGCYTTSSATNNYSLYASTATNAKYLRYAGGTYKSQFANSTFGQRFDVVITPTGSSGMPSGQNDTWSEVDFTATSALCIAHTSPSGTSSKLDGNIYGNIVVDGRLKLIPCIRISDGEIGYYDTYAEAFYAPVTGTPASLGDDTSHLVMSAIGTPEVIGVSAVTPILADNIVDGYGLNSTSGARQSNASRCYTCLGYFPAGTLIKVRAKMTNMGSNLYMYSSDALPTTQTFIESASMTAAEDIGGGWYERTGVSTSAGYLFIQCTVNKATALENLWAVINPSGSSASVADLLGVGNYKDEQDIISGEITRRMGVLVLDGTENWNTGGASVTYFYNSMSDIDQNAEDELICTHYPTTTRNTLTVGTVCIRNGRNGILFSTPYGTTMTEWTTYLAAQYAQGTPVIVLYPLATPKTEVAGAQPLFLSAGVNVLEVNANVSGIQLEATYKARQT